MGLDDPATAVPPLGPTMPVHGRREEEERREEGGGRREKEKNLSFLGYV
jgi:hypothetical protein